MMRTLLAFGLMAISVAAARAGEGSLILHGGGEVSNEVRDRFLELAGGKSARLVIIPTADPSTPLDPSRVESWRRRQPASVELLHADSRSQAEDEAFAAPLRQATGVWISGGRQTTLASTYLRTPVERSLAGLVTRGGVIAGTSAGAAIQSRVMLVRSEIREGFDLLADGVVDQHFVARNRQERLWRVLSAHPHRFGVGVDEDTAAIVSGDKLSVLGSSTVTVCVAAYEGQPQRVERLKHGESFDLKSLRSIVNQRK
jgi:cyanophycinase